MRFKTEVELSNPQIDMLKAWMTQEGWQGGTKEELVQDSVKLLLSSLCGSSVSVKSKAIVR